VVPDKHKQNTCVTRSSGHPEEFWDINDTLVRFTTSARDGHLWGPQELGQLDLDSFFQTFGEDVGDDDRDHDDEDDNHSGGDDDDDDSGDDDDDSGDYDDDAGKGDMMSGTKRKGGRMDDDDDSEKGNMKYDDDDYYSGKGDMTSRTKSKGGRIDESGDESGDDDDSGDNDDDSRKGYTMYDDDDYDDYADIGKGVLMAGSKSKGGMIGGPKGKSGGSKGEDDFPHAEVDDEDNGCHEDDILQVRSFSQLVLIDLCRIYELVLYLQKNG